VSRGRLRAAVRNPLARRFGGYGAGSLVAAASGELGFILTYGWAQAGTTWATAVGFICAAVPNYILNRRWAWSDRRGRSRRAEVSLYLLVVAVTFAASAVVTHWTSTAAVALSPSRAWQTALVAGSYLAVSGVFFLLKFVLYETVVFAPDPTLRSGAVEPQASKPTSC
jgi:putative flippase GtrA